MKTSQQWRAWYRNKYGDVIPPASLLYEALNDMEALEEQLRYWKEEARDWKAQARDCEANHRQD